MQLHLEEMEHDVVMIQIDGGLDGQTSSQLTQALDQMLDQGTRRIIIEGSKLSFVSSMGIGTLMSLHHRMKKRGGDVKIAALQGRVWDVLRTVGLDRLLAIYPDVGRACLAFRPPDATAP